MKRPPNYGPKEFSSDTLVSRETVERLQIYAKVLLKWNQTVNLVGQSTIENLWHRHFLDSAQLYPRISPNSQVLLDLGSGAGFTGLVLAIMGCSCVHLVEKDRTKTTFLREVARLTETEVHIHNAQIDAFEPFPVDIVTARALAPISDLLVWAEPFLGSESVCLFPKGRNVEEELTSIYNIWETEIVRLPSRTDPQSTIVCMRGVRRVRTSS